METLDQIKPMEDDIAPQPAAAAPEEASSSPVSPPTRVVRRAAAFLIDQLFLAAVCIGIGLTLGGLLAGLGFFARLVSMAIALVYFACLHSEIGGGQTLGMRALHLSVVDLDGNLISLPRALLRDALLVLVMLFAGWEVPNLLNNAFLNLLTVVVTTGFGGALLYLFLFNRKTGQSLHDLLAGTRVIYHEGERVESWPVTPRSQKIAATVIAVLLPLVIFGIAQVAFRATSPAVQKLMPLVQALQADGRFLGAGVSDRRQVSSNQPPERILIISLYPKKYPGEDYRNQLVSEAGDLTSRYISLADYQAVVLAIVNQLDLVFYKRSTTWWYVRAEPANNQRVETTSLIGLINFSFNYPMK